MKTLCKASDTSCQLKFPGNGQHDGWMDGFRGVWEQHAAKGETEWLPDSIPINSMKPPPETGFAKMTTFPILEVIRKAIHTYDPVSHCSSSTSLNGAMQIKDSQPRHPIPTPLFLRFSRLG